MRKIILVILLGGVCASAQSMVESAAAAAGGSVGGVAGKKVSDGLSTIFGKVNKTAEKSAREVKDATPSVTPLLEVGPGIPTRDGSAVPPPPPAHHAAVHHAPPPPPPPDPVVVAPIPPPPPPPPPQATAEDLRKVTIGMSRDAVLKLGEPGSRMTMFDDDHLSETFHYFAKDADIGVIHLTDGVVSSVQVPQ